MGSESEGSGWWGTEGGIGRKKREELLGINARRFRRSTPNGLNIVVVSYT
jgi:hypothetical protein